MLWRVIVWLCEKESRHSTNRKMWCDASWTPACRSTWANPARPGLASMKLLRELRTWSLSLLFLPSTSSLFSITVQLQQHPNHTHLTRFNRKIQLLLTYTTSSVQNQATQPPTCRQPNQQHQLLYPRSTRPFKVSPQALLRMPLRRRLQRRSEEQVPVFLAYTTSMIWVSNTVPASSFDNHPRIIRINPIHLGTDYHRATEAEGTELLIAKETQKLNW